MIDVPVRVKDALKSGMYRKNYRVIVLDKDGRTEGTIDNNRLVSESVKLDERMCSGKNLQFGLCEGSSLEFQYFDYENINGKRVKLMLDIEYLDEDGQLAWYEMPMGYFDVASCPMQFSTRIRKATCYNKLKSAYLDEDVTDKVVEIVAQGEKGGSKGVATVDTILYDLLSGYAIEEYNSLAVNMSQSSKPRGTLKYLDLRYDIPGQSVRTSYAHVHYLTYSKTFSFDDVKKGDYFRYYINKKSFNDYFNSLLSALSNNYTDGNHKTWSDYVKNGTVPHSITGTGTIPSFDLYDLESSESVTSDYVLVDADNRTITVNYVFYVKVTTAVNKIPELYSIDDLYRLFGDEIATERERIEGLIFNTTQYLRFDKRKEKIGSKIQIKSSNLENIKSGGITLRDMQSAIFELNCQFGRLSRSSDQFKGLSLNNNRLVPSDTLYPSNSLYPISDAERSDASSYEKLWTDSAGVQKFRYLIITYKGIVDGQEKDCVLQRTVNTNGTQDYNMSSNWLFKNLVWTEQQIGEYADAMVELMRNVSWFPFEMWSAGLPYLETGDELEITNSEGAYTSYILQRQLNGIQMLKDTYINGELDIF